MRSSLRGKLDFLNLCKVFIPADFLRALFEALYDEEIISEDSVTAWEKSDEEPVGKGNALNSVQGFLTWLKNSEEETYDDSK